MKIWILAASIIGSAFITNLSHAYNIADVQLPEVISATAERPELKLNGASLRELYLLIKTYVGALYLESPSTNPDVIINSESHKSMVFHVMMKRVGARRIATALQEALVVNLTEAEHKNLTRITINNEVKGVIPGKDYFKAMLSIWIGENPVGRSFKNEVLGLKTQKDQSMVAGQ